MKTKSRLGASSFGATLMTDAVAKDMKLPRPLVMLAGLNMESIDEAKATTARQFIPGGGSSEQARNVIKQAGGSLVAHHATRL